jgi:3-hydroxybutyryl-CoA dehydrogenase
MTTSLEDLGDCDIIIEAVTEDLELKNGMFRTLDDVCAPNTPSSPATRAR